MPEKLKQIRLPSLQSVIPETKLAAVERALLQVTGTTDAADIVQLAGGLSTSLLLKFSSNGHAYVMRVIMQSDPFNDPAHLFACTEVAAGMGVAPLSFIPMLLMAYWSQALLKILTYERALSLQISCWQNWQIQLRPYMPHRYSPKRWSYSPSLMI